MVLSHILMSDGDVQKINKKLNNNLMICTCHGRRGFFVTTEHRTSKTKPCFTDRTNIVVLQSNGNKLTKNRRERERERENKNNVISGHRFRSPIE